MRRNICKIVENKLYLKKKLFRFDYKKCISIKFFDGDKAAFLLNSLTESDEFLITTLLHGITDIDFEDVSNVLMNNEVGKKEKEAYQDSSSNVLTACGRTSTLKKSERGKSRSKSRGRYDNWRKLDKNECAYCR